MICGLEKVEYQNETLSEDYQNYFIFKAPEGICLITDEIAQSIEEQKSRGWMPVIRHFCTELRGVNPSAMVCVDCGRIWHITLSSK